MNVAGGYDRRRGKCQVSVIARTLRVQSLSERVPHVVLIGSTVWEVVDGIATGLPWGSWSGGACRVLLFWQLSSLPIGVGARYAWLCVWLFRLIMLFWVCLALCVALSPDHVVFGVHGFVCGSFA